MVTTRMLLRGLVTRQQRRRRCSVLPTAAELHTTVKAGMQQLDSRQSEKCPKSLIGVYTELVERGELTADASQARVVARFLDRLHRQLENYRVPFVGGGLVSEGSGSSDLGTPGNGNQGGEEHEQEAQPVMVPRGLYLHGHVGTGKSMLMDLFFAHAPVASKRRVHFNAFMLEVHQRLQTVKRDQLERFGRQRHVDLDPRRDAISIVAEQLVRETHLLCFDEFQVTDVADAMIMRKLFGVFFSNGGVMVATSNTPPQHLYENGTNREYFLPFLQQLARHTKVVDINSLVDYRTLAEPNAQQTFFHPLSATTEKSVDALVTEITGGDLMGRLRIPVAMGRHLDVTGSQEGVARVTFDELCKTEKSAADYKALSECFVVLEGVPLLDMRGHDPARRFILLIDEMYERHTRLILSAEGPPHRIFQFDDAPLADHADMLQQSQQDKAAHLEESAREGIPPASSWDAPVGSYNPAKMPGLQVQNLCALQDLRIAFKRAVSRMTEMQSAAYLEKNEVLRLTRQQHLLTTIVSE